MQEETWPPDQGTRGVHEGYEGRRWGWGGGGSSRGHGHLICYNSHGVSLTLIVISLNPTTNYESDLGLLNSLFKSTLVCASDARRLSKQNLIYHVSMQSYREVTICTFLILSSVIYCIVHTAFATNLNYYVSSHPMPLRISSFIMFSILNGGGGGGGVGEGVCGGGGGWYEIDC